VRAIFAVTRRELASYFGSWTAYVLLAVYLVLSGYFFYSDLAFFVTFGAQNLATGLWRFVFIDYRLVTLLVLPLVTMRLFAEERKLGTIELLWTLPVRDYQLIAGKFLAAWIFFLVTVALATIPFAVLWFFHPFELGPPIAGLIGLVLLGTAFISCGLAVLVSVWGFLSQPAHTSVSAEEIALTPEAHGGDTVTVIVADFRGLDTLVEVTVLLAAVIGVAALLRRGKLW